MRGKKSKQESKERETRRKSLKHKAVEVPKNARHSTSRGWPYLENGHGACCQGAVLAPKHSGYLRRQARSDMASREIHGRCTCAASEKSALTAPTTRGPGLRLQRPTRSSESRMEISATLNHATRATTGLSETKHTRKKLSNSLSARNGTRSECCGIPIDATRADRSTGNEGALGSIALRPPAVAVRANHSFLRAVRTSPLRPLPLAAPRACGRSRASRAKPKDRPSKIGRRETLTHGPQSTCLRA